MQFNGEESEKLAKIEEFATDKVRKAASKIDSLSEYPGQLVKEMADLGMFALYIPRQYGGDGMSLHTLMEAVRIISRECASTALILDVTVSLFAEPIMKYGNEVLKEEYLSRVARGEIGALAITEPGAGSDAASIKATAKREGNKYLIKGAKTFITNGKEASFYVVSAMTSPDNKHKGMTLFAVDRKSAGLSIGNEFRKMGIRGTSTTEVLLDNVEVGKDDVIGRVNEGFRIEMDTLNVGRIGIASQAIGISEGAFSDVLRFASETQTEPKENLKFRISDMANLLHSSVRNYEEAIHHSESGNNSPLHSSMAKLQAGDSSVAITSSASEILGYYAMTEEYPLERRYREAKITQIYEGTNEIQRLVIAKEILRSGIRF
jgi:alkylation response protein AidB-like acyl-CoA dehydrogenase